ncbi:MAG: response regulator [Gemmatimonadales bacterium]|nr:response regulator [Gemmatimonadales bacterium]
MMDVLVVDDDTKVREAHTKVLERAGFMVTAVDNGLAAFAALQEERYKVIVCDIQMPYLEGKNFYQQLEEVLPTMASRVVFVTAWASEESTRQFLEQSGQPFLEKPADVNELISLVRHIADKPG